jgi:hypothetical protein
MCTVLAALNSCPPLPSLLHTNSRGLISCSPGFFLFFLLLGGGMVPFARRNIESRDSTDRILYLGCVRKPDGESTYTPRRRLWHHAPGGGPETQGVSRGADQEEARKLGCGGENPHKNNQQNRSRKPEIEKQTAKIETHNQQNTESRAGRQAARLGPRSVSFISTHFQWVALQITIS